MDAATKVRHVALNLLARREHSKHELRRKLLNKSHPEDLVDTTLASLQEEGLQSDARYTEAYIRLRANKGYGRARIVQELHERGISDHLLTDYLAETDIDWYTLAREVREKRFGTVMPDEFPERAKQQRFLQYRGFSNDEIRQVFD